MSDNPPITGTVGQNPTRHYKRDFRPRQMMAGFGVLDSETNYATVSLYNNSQSAEYLVVRYAATSPYQWHTSYNAGFAWYQGVLGTHTGAEARIMSGEGLLSGRVYTADTTTNLSPTAGAIYAWGDTNAGYGYFPVLAVVQPGWSWCFQNQTNSVPTQCAFMWEVIFPDELDYFYSL